MPRNYWTSVRSSFRCQQKVGEVHFEKSFIIRSKTEIFPLRLCVELHINCKTIVTVNGGLAKNRKMLIQLNDDVQTSNDWNWVFVSFSRRESFCIIIAYKKQKGIHSNCDNICWILIKCVNYSICAEISFIFYAVIFHVEIVITVIHI